MHECEWHYRAILLEQSTPTRYIAQIHVNYLHLLNTGTINGTSMREWDARTNSNSHCSNLTPSRTREPEKTAQSSSVSRSVASSSRSAPTSSLKHTNDGTCGGEEILKNPCHRATSRNPQYLVGAYVESTRFDRICLFPREVFLALKSPSHCMSTVLDNLFFRGIQHFEFFLAGYNICRIV